MVLKSEQEIIDDGFNIARDEFNAEIQKLSRLPGFDATGLKAAYPEILDINSPEGNFKLKQYVEIVDGLSNHPKFTLIARLTTKALEYDTKDPLQGVDRIWARVYLDLKPEAFVFTEGDDENQPTAEIYAPTIQLGKADGLSSVDKVVLDGPRSKHIMLGKLEEWDVPPHIVFADDWETLVSRARQYDHKFKIFGGNGISATLIQSDAIRDLIKSGYV
ncbi:MAG TPA: hypothetical protein PK265_03425 [Candidatus Saccharibacteria bacterium]|nr:hypothetical protein [Candidatus Saccharibacteria bacterium]HRQ98345.1 hypothetical protein [Candidatus Saccharibacteria bacterium]